MGFPRKAGRGLRTLIGHLPLLSWLEGQYIQGYVGIGLPPIFIIGLPRSGSTLLYQLIAHAYQCSYFSNLAALFYRSPALMTRFTVGLIDSYKTTEFKNDHGFVHGFGAPSEAGAIHKVWFRNSNSRYASDSTIRNTCSRIADTMKGPFVWKNLNNSHVLTILHRCFPTALFVKIERDLALTCQSIYFSAVEEDLGNIYGLHANSIQTGEESISQLVNQVVGINKQIDGFLNESSCRFHRISYENLCTDLDTELLALEDKYSESGSHLKRKANARLPELETSRRVKVSTQDWQLIVRTLDRAG